MKDQTFLNNLADFKDIRLNSRSELMDIQNRSRDSLLSKNSHLDFELDLHNNDKLLKNFKQLRQQLKQSTKICQKLKTKLDEKETQVERLKQSERDYISINHQLKHEIDHMKNSNEDLKSKIDLLKSMTKNSNQAEQQLQFLKITISNLKAQMSSLQDEKNKLLELSIVEKVELEQKIKRFEAKKNSDIAYVQQMQIQVSKFREKTIKLENELKKMQIKYDEELYTKQWANGNFQRQHLQQQLRQAEAENQELLAKHKKQKQKRATLEKRVLQLQQTTGLWIVKAQTYQIENRGLQKKYKQIQKKNEQVKEQSNKKVSQILTLEEKFAKSVAIADQLISRVKRQLYGDMVALAKSCQFKLSKLKQQKDTFFKNMENQQQQQLKKSASELKMRSKSKQNYRDRCQQKQGVDIDSKQAMINLKEKFEDCIKPQMQTQTQTFLNNMEKSKTNYDQSGRSNGTFSNSSNLQYSALGHIQNIEARIKRQRDQMEKKIREKMLYRKIEVAHSPEKHQLREDYFRLFEH